ncbi:MAG TPA: cytochrome c biogenesis protein CcdA [Ktedonobacterales bacterium]
MEIGHSVGLGVLLAAFAGGLLSFFSPCVAPLIPGYIGYLSGTTLSPSEKEIAPTQRADWLHNPALRASALFATGFSAAFIALGLLSASLGGLLTAYKPVMETIAGILMLAMGAFLLELLPAPMNRLLLREGRLHLAPTAASRLGVAAPFALGLVFAAGWTPCIGPVLGAILAYVGVSGSITTAGLLLSVYSLGFAVPFLAVGLGWSASLTLLRLAKRYGLIISRLSGIALVLVGVLYLTGHAETFALWARQLGSPALPRSAAVGAALLYVVRGVMRTAHVLAGAAWVGGSLIYLIVLGPALRVSGASAELGAAIAARFRSLVSISIGTLLVTGVFLVADRLATQNAGWAYWIVLALKIAVSLALFALAAYQAQEARRSPKQRSTFYRVAPRWILALGIAAFALGTTLTILFETPH